MDLKTFIKETLLDINAAIREAQQEEEKRTGAKAYISPSGTTIKDHKITFDIALTEAESGEAEGRIGVFLGGMVGAGVKGTTKGENSSLSRIQFEIPVIYPTGSRPR